MGSLRAEYIGHSWGMHLNEVDFLKNASSLRTKIKEAKNSSLVAMALKNAAKAVVEAIVEELADLERTGDQTPRKYSDPKNVRLRNEAFVDTAEGELRRLSGGEWGFEPSSISTIRNAQVESSELFDHLVARRIG